MLGEAGRSWEELVKLGEAGRSWEKLAEGGEAGFMSMFTKRNATSKSDL